MIARTDLKSLTQLDLPIQLLRKNPTKTVKRNNQNDVQETFPIGPFGLNRLHCLRCCK